MSKYISTFGVEIHAALDTKTKAFSPAENVFGAEPNTKVHPVDMGYPGSKPRVNSKMVEHSYRLALALNMDVENVMYFDRKNYFYPDLASGYQITQYEKPIGRNGNLTIELDDGTRKDISITEIHMEQDTAKQTRKKGRRLFDFNRAGAPLIEIVSGHKELATVSEVIEYVKTMREQLVVLGISRAILAEGTFRVDINVSVRPENQIEYGTRVEIKNVNSFTNIEKALNYEIKLMKQTLREGNNVLPVTKRFDESTGKTVTMRSKDTAVLYNFIPEGNITPIELTQEFIDNAISKGTKTVIEIRKEYEKILTKEQYTSVTQSGPLFKLFVRLTKNNDPVKVANFISQTLISILKTNKDKMTDSILSNIDFNIILNLIENKKLTNKDVFILLIKAIKEEKSIDLDLKNAQDAKDMSLEDIELMIRKLIETNNKLRDKIAKGENVNGFITGQVMKATKGQAKTEDVVKIILKVLN